MRQMDNQVLFCSIRHEARNPGQEPLSSRSIRRQAVAPSVMPPLMILGTSLGFTCSSSATRTSTPLLQISCSSPGSITHAVACNAHCREMQALAASTRKTISPLAMSRYAVSHKPLVLPQIA
jgi:hypothetical protein